MPCHPCVIDLTACRLQGDACEPPHGPRVRLCVSHHMPGRVRRRPARAARADQYVSTTRGGGVVRAAATTIVVVVVVGPLTRHLDDSGLLCLGGAGYIILIASRNAALSYVAVYLATWYVPPSRLPPATDSPLPNSGIYPLIRTYARSFHQRCRILTGGRFVASRSKHNVRRLYRSLRCGAALTTPVFVCFPARGYRITSRARINAASPSRWS